MSLGFEPTGTDSPHRLTLVLPPGLLANASIDGGACLTTVDLTDSSCQIGTGTVTAFPSGLDIPITVPVTFDLVPPPTAGDLAGIAVNSNGTQIGATADVRVRPSGDPAGVGVTIGFVLPDALDGVPISISSIDSTFSGLRYPATCPANPQDVTVAADSYADPTVRTASAPLLVTGCSGLPFAPALHTTATRDLGDDRVVLVADVTQGATQSPASAMTLAFPISVLTPNLSSLRALCSTPGPACAAVGSATAISPLYPRQLTGDAYLTGSFTALSLTIVFPPPLPLTLTGRIDLALNGTVFTGLPDIPLSGLRVLIDGGPNGLFRADCRSRTGTANATLTDQNADRTVTAASTFTVAGCPNRRVSDHGRPRLARASVTRLRDGRLRLALRIAATRGSPPLARLSIALPRELELVAHQHGRRTVVVDVSLSGARVRAASRLHGRLVLSLRRPARSVAVTLGPGALRIRGALIGRRLTAVVVALTARGSRFVLHRRLRILEANRAGPRR